MESQLMARIRSKNTRAELALFGALRRARLGRFRTHFGEPSADVAYRGARVVVFLDSCFWHHCRSHGTVPRTRRAWWAKKLAGNARLDRRSTREWRDRGWTVVRLWSHLSEKAMVERVRRAVEEGRRRQRLRALLRRRPPWEDWLAQETIEALTRRGDL